MNCASDKWRDGLEVMHDGPEMIASSELESVPACPICKSTERQLLYSDLRDLQFESVGGEWHFFRCNVCGGGWLDPRPSKKAIGKLYRRYFTHEKQQQTDRHWASRMAQELKRGYWHSWYGHPFAGAKPLLGRIVALLLPPVRQDWDYQIRHLPAAKASSSLLDVGCGNGKFLSLAREAGWQVEGCDVDEAALELARTHGLNVHARLPDQLAQEGKQYDIITLSHVIEHLHDPLKMLADCLTILKPGGLLWLATPNLESGLHKKFGAAWQHMDPPRHLVLFTANSLAVSLMALGLNNASTKPRGLHVYRSFATSVAIKGKVIQPTKNRRLRWRDFPEIVFREAIASISTRNSEEIVVFVRHRGE